ncbi:rano class II histocompatibility antigen, A beta chain-like isoform X2 [Alosa sapidissima]|uniref:rano class II histocompatibility antigen, A beta chain-like isoform X2 n=1 Tax=Alosa sapidissima TaxID=34773 RepID=UPI001C080C17|nr:rano class II histocompatibility antigen, A beta chain-like isoform X2 [Alosa sapidissima]
MRMSTAQLFISGVIVLATLSGAHGDNGYYTSLVDQCRFSSWDLSDLEYISSYWFNKDKFVVFNSTVGKFVGYSEFGVYNAERWNNDPAILAQMRAEKDRSCKPNAQTKIDSILTKTVEPEMTLKLTRPSSGGHPAVLTCSAYNFYPKLIKMTWFRDGQEVTGDVVTSEELADGDWYYQMHSHLEFTPKAGEKISCMVEHASLKEPKELVWEPSMSRADWYMVAMGVAEMVLGLILAAAGIIYYKKKTRGRISASKTSMDKGFHQKNMDTNFLLWLLSSYRSFSAHCDSKTPVKKSILNTVCSDH